METSGPLRGEVRAPPSKSVTNRALLLAALARGDSILRRPLEADDTLFMAGALAKLGIAVESAPDGTLHVAGAGGGLPALKAELFLGNAGTAMRFLAAAVTLGSGTYLLDGEPRMRQRPLGDLVAALRQLGIRPEFPGRDGYPPVALSGGPLRGGRVTLRADRSSQFASALLMVAPCTAGGLDVRLEGSLVSAPYVDLTLGLMARFGGPTVESRPGGYRVPGGGGYRGTDLTIEGDASSAAALLSAAAVTGGKVTVTALPADSCQPDRRFAELLGEMGCRVTRRRDAVELQGKPLRGIRADVGSCPDVTPVLAAAALFADGPTRIAGAPHLRLKESDRISDLAAELGKLGARVDEHDDGLTVHPGPLHGARVDPHRDHRLAMAFAVVGLRVEGVEIENPGCVAKSFPDFFEVLDSLRP
jgi:3-phosphoshikimate 1-carboxyvinyltransferase